jgi:hypothetical protein
MPVVITLDTNQGVKAVTSDGHNTLLVFDVDPESLERSTVLGTWAVRVRDGANGLIVADLFGERVGADPWFELVALDVASLTEPVARLEISRSSVHWDGADSLWRQLPRLHDRWVGPPRSRDVLVLLEREPGKVRILDVPDDEELMDREMPLVAVPTPDEQVVTLGRTGAGDALVIYELRQGRVLGIIQLPRVLSHVTPQFRPGTWEAWVACRSQLVRVDVSSSRVIQQLDIGTWREDHISRLFVRPGLPDLCRGPVSVWCGAGGGCRRIHGDAQERNG